MRACDRIKNSANNSEPFAPKCRVFHGAKGVESGVPQLVTGSIPDEIVVLQNPCESPFRGN